MFFPVNGDPYYSNVSLLLPMTGANNSTTFTDYSPSPKTITRAGDTKISTAQSKWGNGAGYFDGTGDYLSIAQSTDLDLGSGDFTVEVWIYHTSRPAPQSLFCMGDYGNALTTSLIFYIYTDGKLAAYGGTVNILASSVSLNAWHHCATVRSGTTLTVYLDGVSIGTATTSNNFSGIVHIGAEKFNNTVIARMNGYLQDTRITKGVARYTANFTPPIALLSPRLPEMPVRSAIIHPHQFHQIARLGL